MTHIKSYTLGELAKQIDATVEGDAECEITGLGTLASAGPGQLSFFSNPAYIEQLKTTSASAVIVDARFAEYTTANKLISKSPYVSFALATRLFDSSFDAVPGIHPSATIAADVSIADDVSIGPQAVIEAGASIGKGSNIGANVYVGAGVIIGANCHIYGGVTLYHQVTLGSNVIIHAGTVVGSDGFGFAFDGEKHVKIHQLGGVNIADDVEIGAGSTIDRGAIEDTVIKQGVKIDNQVQIGHNCVIGEHSIICGCAGLAGSVTLGKYCIMGGGSGAVGHITLVDRVQVSAMSLVSKSITKAGMYSSGTGHMPTSEWKRSIVRFQQLDSIAKRLKEIEKGTDNN